MYKNFMFRRAVSNMALQEYDLAEKDLILARKLEPANRYRYLPIYTGTYLPTHRNSSGTDLFRFLEGMGV